ncbi:putative D-xylose utilization operon transcriptional repressor [Vibrio stylophorae]|uniref:D-xylose utilization operon transcriptional repressor n=1 Tax=Vibrio stylophorae TaxID=659351 RepID=A0ABN8DTH4_9VIBR|nr:GntR family transcriptional regulator [Vibrio stylophorae]CAH0533220.1 putative D-xylose utilization operon transcriptional repressor [Vibrio stylophorae]
MKINKQSLEEQATDYIRNMILSGVLGLGDKIVESTLSKELELSRSTLRMALNSLSHEGLVVQKPYVGWHVFTLEGDDLWELYNLRVAIESQAALMAAERADQQDKKELRRIYDEFCEFCTQGPLDIEEVCVKDFEFHRKVVEITKSTKFIKIYEQISNQLRCYIKMTHHDYDLSLSGLSHRGIVEAIVDGDTDRAWRESKLNITTFTDLCRQNLEAKS